MVVGWVLCISIRANEKRCCYVIYIEEKAKRLVTYRRVKEESSNVT